MAWALSRNYKIHNPFAQGSGSIKAGLILVVCYKMINIKYICVYIVLNSVTAKIQYIFSELYKAMRPHPKLGKSWLPDESLTLWPDGLGKILKTNAN